MSKQDRLENQDNDTQRMLTVTGPNKIAPSPVPVICEQLPVTDGIFNDESTKMNAPAMARRVMDLRFAETVFLSDR